MYKYEKLQEILDKKNMTSYQLAKATGISTATFSAWKRDIYCPKEAKIKTITEYLGITPEQLTDNPSPAQTIVDEPELTEQEKNILELFRKLNKEDSERAIKIMEKLAELSDLVNLYGENAMDNIKQMK